MKRIIAAGITLLLLVCISAASAGTSGSSSDPLVSLSHISEVFTKALLDEGTQTVGDRLTQAYDEAFARLEEIYKSYIGYSFTASFTELELKAEQRANLITGTSFVLLSGSAVLDITAGVVVNVSTGYEVAPGSLLTPNQRYFCTENTTAVIKASSDSMGLIDGYFTTNGKLDPNKTVFKDVRKPDWFCSAVEFVYELGLFAGTSEDTFSPAMPMTRAMFVTVLYRHAGKPVPLSVNSFSDVLDTGEYYYEPVTWASENGIVAGYEDGTFLPNLSITREQMALIIYRYAAFAGYEMSSPGSAYDGFPDAGDVAPYAVEAMRWAVSNGIINGSDGSLLPAATATRAQVAQIIYNLCQKLADIPPSSEETGLDGEADLENPESESEETTDETLDEEIPQDLAFG